MSNEKESQLFEITQNKGLNKIDRDRRFTIFFGPSAKDMAKQVQLFGSSDIAGSILGQLLLDASGGTPSWELVEIDSKVDATNKYICQLSGELKILADQLEKKDVNITTLEFQRLLLSKFGNSASTLGAGLLLVDTSSKESAEKTNLKAEGILTGLSQN